MKLPHRHHRVGTALGCALLAALAQVGYADTVDLGSVAAGPDAVAAFDETPNRWFVELASAPTADGSSLATVRAEKNAFRKAAKAAGIKFTERYSYDVLFNGLSIEIAPTDFGKLSRLSGVKALYPVVTESLPPTQPGSDLDMANAVGMTGADIAQNELGLTGAGVKVAVIDSGIDFDHPDFGGNGVPGDGISPDPNFGPSGNSRVKYGYDFVGDNYNAGGTAAQQVATPDNNPDSCRNYNGDAGSHGTHVAGIVGASGTPPTGVRGVAPGVTFGAYRVFGCSGSTSTDIMAAAMERAYLDGMNVVNMSIGSTFQWPEYPSAVAATRLVNKGVSVVASIGNSGAVSTTVAGGVWTAGAPGTGAKVIGVASFDNTKASQKAFSVNGTLYGFNQATASPPAPITGTFPYTFIGTTATVNAGCNGTTMPADLTGQIAVVRRGTCGFYEKAMNMQARNAAAVVLFNNAAGELNATVAPVAPATAPVTISVVGITAANGTALFNASPKNLTWTSQVVETPIPTAGLISSFSSWGMAADLSLKPDIGAPGGSIRSTYPIEYGSYATISGTSMASPHVAGAVALLLQAKPNTPANAIRDLLENQAIPHAWSGNPNLGILDAAHRQGAGMLQIADTIMATTHVSPGKLSLGESELGPVTRTLTVRNDGASAETYDLSFTDAISTLGSYTYSNFLGASSVVFSQGGVPTTSITVPAGGSASFDMTIAPDPSLPNKAQYSGFVNIVAQSSSGDVHVPAAGLKGDYQSIQVLTPTANGYPWLAQTTNGTSFSNRPSGATYTMAGFDVPYVIAHFDHQSRRVRMEVFGTNGKAWHKAFQDLEYFGKNSLSTSFFSFAWDGTTINGNKVQTAPNGTYVLKLSVLKANGDESNPAHWETFTTSTITVARP